MPSLSYAIYWGSILLPIGFFAVEMSAVIRKQYWNTFTGWTAATFDVWHPWLSLTNHHVAINWRRMILAAFMAALSLHLVEHVTAKWTVIPFGVPLFVVIVLGTVGEIRAWRTT